MRHVQADKHIKRSAFTLIELLVVMAITAILLGLIFGPMVQGFNLTNRARVQALTQDTARRAMELISRDVSNGVFIFDNTPLYNPNSPNQDLRSIYLWVRAADANGYPNGNPFATALPYGMVDLVPPARANDQNAQLTAAQVDPTTGLALSRGDIALPLRPGRVIIRYFLGLRDNTSTDVGGQGQPNKPYANFYADPQHTNLNDHNPVILYRAVVSPYLPDGSVDQRFFHVAQGTTNTPALYDPNFFYDTTQTPTTDTNGQPMPPIPGFTSTNAQETAQGFGAVWENWKSIARAVVPTDRADEVIWARDQNTNKVIYLNGVPEINPLVRFQPTYVGNDAGTPTNVSDAGNEVPNVAPSTTVESYGHWTVPFDLYVYQQGLDAAQLPFFYWKNTGNLSDGVTNLTYDSATKQVTSNATAYYFPNWSPILLDPQTAIQVVPAGSGQSAPSAPPQIMFTVDARRGLVNYAFPDSVMLHDANGHPTPSTWMGNDNANGIPAINANFAAVRQSDPQQLANTYRYVSLLTPPSNNGKSPLNTLSPVSIVPGSEVVTGPDMRPGPNYGNPVVYTRLPSTSDPHRDLGPNQYIINYADVPNKQTPNNVDAGLFAMETAAQTAGTIIFDSREDTSTAGDPHTIPTVDQNNNPTKITVTYQFQMNKPSYTAKADYLTRQLMTFSLGVQLYEFNSGQPQQVTLTQKIKVRNVQR